MMVLIPERAQGFTDGAVRLTASTDNLGNAKLLDKYMTSKFPLAPVLMELAAQSEARGVRLHVEWTPREQNEEADGITNFNLSMFDPKLRVHVDPTKLNFMVLNDMLTTGLELFELAAAARTERAQQQTAGPPRKRKGLRETDPW